MKTIQKTIYSALPMLLISTALSLTIPVEACTRALYQGTGGRVLTGRTMDWKLEILSNLWIFPQGMERHGAAGPNSLTWTSRYGSLAVSGYNISTVDGMNEPGLVVNAQWLANSKYPEDDGKTPRTSLSIWSQYFLDNFATVAESIAHIRANPFHVATGEIPGQPGRLSTLHLSLSDATGDSAILEWVDGKLRIHHDRRYQVMTNEPVFEDQLAIAQYWRQVDGLTFLPGTSRATDRFARASFYINAIPETDDPRVAAASVFSVIRNASVPYGISLSDQPNLSTTRWRVVADQKDKLYYFESAISPNVFWVDLKKVDFSPESGVRTLDLGDNQQIVFSGEVSSQFVTAKPFVFEAAQ